MKYINSNKICIAEAREWVYCFADLIDEVFHYDWSTYIEVAEINTVVSEADHTEYIEVEEAEIVHASLPEVVEEANIEVIEITQTIEKDSPSEDDNPASDFIGYSINYNEESAVGDLLISGHEEIVLETEPELAFGATESTEIVRIIVPEVVPEVVPDVVPDVVPVVVQEEIVPAIIIDSSHIINDRDNIRWIGRHLSTILMHLQTEIAGIKEIPYLDCVFGLQNAGNFYSTLGYSFFTQLKYYRVQWIKLVNLLIFYKTYSY